MIRSIVRRISQPALLLALSLSAGCASITPPPTQHSALAVPPRAEALSGPAEGATETLLGVRLDAILNAWDAPGGKPLGTVVPVRVELHNEGPVALQIDPSRFRLASTTSLRAYRALPPKQLLVPLRDQTRTTAHIQLRSLRAGVLNRGARVAGFLFFEQPAAGELGVRLQAPLIAEESGRELGVIEIPLAVVR